MLPVGVRGTAVSCGRDMSPAHACEKGRDPGRPLQAGTHTPQRCTPAKLWHSIER